MNISLNAAATFNLNLNEFYFGCDASKERPKKKKNELKRTHKKIFIRIAMGNRVTRESQNRRFCCCLRVVLFFVGHFCFGCGTKAKVAAVEIRSNTHWPIEKQPQHTHTVDIWSYAIQSQSKWSSSGEEVG